MFTDTTIEKIILFCDIRTIIKSIPKVCLLWNKTYKDVVKLYYFNYFMKPLFLLFDGKELKRQENERCYTKRYQW